MSSPSPSPSPEPNHPAELPAGLPAGLPVGLALTANAAASYAELAQIVLSREPLGVVLARIAQLAQARIPGVDEVSITLIENGRPRSVAFSGQLAATLDERQYQIEFGPCLDAAVTGTVVTVPDTAHEPTYPEFAELAARAGIRHIHSVGMPAIVQGRTGGMNCYGRGDPLTPEAADLAAGLASYLAVAVVNAAVYAGALDEIEHMHTAMASRAVIEQAKGIIMSTRHCNADQAFDTLRNASSRAQRKLRDLAQELVDSTIRP